MAGCRAFGRASVSSGSCLIFRVSSPAYTGERRRRALLYLPNRSLLFRHRASGDIPSPLSGAVRGNDPCRLCNPWASSWRTALTDIPAKPVLFRFWFCGHRPDGQQRPFPGGGASLCGAISPGGGEPARLAEYLCGRSGTPCESDNAAISFAQIVLAQRHALAVRPAPPS